jgi:hypothetical protein
MSLLTTEALEVYYARLNGYSFPDLRGVQTEVCGPACEKQRKVEPVICKPAIPQAAYRGGQESAKKAKHWWNRNG